MKRLDTYYRSMSDKERNAFVERAGCTRGYMDVSLVYRRKIPRKDLMRRLAAASLGALSYEDIVHFFFLLPEDIQSMAA